MKRFNIGKKLSGAVVIATAFIMGVTPMTAFAQSNEAAEDVAAEESVSDNSIATEISEDTELDYNYTVNEDGSVVFNFNGEEYTYGEKEDPTGKVVTKGSRLNVRTGAGMDYEVIDQLCPGEEVSVIGTEGDWYKITVPAKTGYVHGNYLEVLENATNETDEALLQMFMMMFMNGMNDADRNCALTPDGNLTLVDDYGSAEKSGKQFITVVTKAGNYFYIIIDCDDEGNETVHFLNLVDEADLLSLMEEEDAKAYLDSGEEEPVTEVEEPVTEGPEEPETVVEEPEKKSSPTAALVLMFLAGVGAIGGYVYFKSSKKKDAKKQSVDPDIDYDEGEDFLADMDIEEEDLTPDADENIAEDFDVDEE